MPALLRLQSAPFLFVPLGDRMIEKEHKDANRETPEALYNAIPVMRPMGRGQLFSATQQPGHFSFLKNNYLLLPVLNWHDIWAIQMHA